MKKLLVKLLASHAPKGTIDFSNIRSVLIRPIGEGLGDAVVLSAVCGQLKKAYPACQIAVLTTPRNFPIYQKIPSIDALLPDAFFTYLKSAKKYDVFLDYRPTFTTRNLVCDFFLKPAYTICFEKEAKKNYSPETIHNYNFYVPNLAACHLSQSLSLTPFQKYLDTQAPVYTLEKPADLSSVNKFLKQDKKNIVLCPFGSDKWLDKQLLTHVICTLAKQAPVHFICPFPAEKYPLGEGENITYTGPLSLDDFLALIYQADLVLSVDSAPVHIACAYQKPLVAVYAGWKRGCTLFYPLSNPLFRALQSTQQANGPVQHITQWPTEKVISDVTYLLQHRPKII